MFAHAPEINAKDRRAVQAADPADYVLWLLYAYSPQGAGIRHPALFALRKVQSAAMPPAEVSWFRKIGPDELRRLLAYPAPGADWERLLPRNPTRRTELARRLGLAAPGGP